MNILHKLIGKWEKESQAIGTATYSSIFCKDWEESVILIVEKHSLTGKKRAYTKDIRGYKTPIDVDYLKEISK